MIQTTAAKLVLGQKEEIKFLFGQILADSLRKTSGDRNQEPIRTVSLEAGNADVKAQPLARAERQKADLMGKKLSTKSHMPLKH